MFFETKSEASAECERLKARKANFRVSLNANIRYPSPSGSGSYIRDGCSAFFTDSGSSRGRSQISGQNIGAGGSDIKGKRQYFYIGGLCRKCAHYQAERRCQ